MIEVLKTGIFVLAAVGSVNWSWDAGRRAYDAGDTIGAVLAIPAAVILAATFIYGAVGSIATLIGATP